jgi:DNA-binding transcriptional LysR family regulator
MAEFIRANPKIDLVVDCGFWPDRPLAGEVDLALTFEEPKNPDMIATPLAHFHYVLFASQDYLDLYGAPMTEHEVATHPYVHHVGQSHHRENWKPSFIAFQDFMHKRIETNSSAVSFSAVKHGAGVAPMPTAILALEPSLVMIATPMPNTIRLWLVHHRDIGRSARVRRVIDWLKEAFDPKTKPWYRAEFIHPREFGPYLNQKPTPVPVAEPQAAPSRRTRGQG